jgi:hypothetical protein
MAANKSKSDQKRKLGDTPRKHRNLREPWKPGQSGNPKGRPKGDFDEYGVEAIKAVRETKPEVYVKIVADLLPKEANINVDHGEAFTKIWHMISDGRGEEIARAMDAAANDDDDTVH